MPIQIKRSSAAGTLSLTPLVDVVFLLLIFFLVASRFAQEDRTLPVELPSASAAVPMTERPREITVNIDAEGNVDIEGRPTDATELQAILARAVASNPVGQTVIIRADRRASLQAFVEVADLCRQTGVANYPLVVQDKP